MAVERAEQRFTVGHVADKTGVTVRTLHHYDKVGLLSPCERSPAGSRVYSRTDIERLQQIVLYRPLEFGLDQIVELLDSWQSSAEHLRRQRAAVFSWADKLSVLVGAIDQTFVDAKRVGHPADGDNAMAIAECARRQIDFRFYDCAPSFHRCLGEMYVTDPRFTATCDELEA